MAGKRKYAATRTRRRVRRRLTYRPRMRVRKALPLSGFPASKIVKLRYVSDSFTINPSLSGVATHVFRANSIQDPDFTGVGHQPYGHDTWQTLYNHYTVIGSKITVRLQTSSGNAANSFALAGLGLRDDSTATTTLGLAVESGRCSFRYLGTDDAKNGMIRMTKGYSCKKWFGKTYNASGTQRAAFGNNPSEEVFYHVSVESAAGDDLGAVYGQAVIEYICLLQEPKDLGQS